MIIYHPEDQELTNYFARESVVFGLRSSFEPLVNLANSGFVGSKDPERTMVNHVDRHRGEIGPMLRIRKALRHCTPQTRTVLFAAFGPIAWGQRFDALVGRGAGITAERLWGDLLGPALLSMPEDAADLRIRALAKMGDRKREPLRKLAVKLLVEARDDYRVGRYRDRDELAAARPRRRSPGVAKVSSVSVFMEV